MNEIIGAILPWAIGALGFLGAMLWARNGGRKAEQAKQNETKLKAVEKAKGVRDEVNKVPDSDLDDRLAEWLRNDKR